MPIPNETIHFSHSVIVHSVLVAFAFPYSPTANDYGCRWSNRNNDSSAKKSASDFEIHVLHCNLICWNVTFFLPEHPNFNVLQWTLLISTLRICSTPETKANAEIATTHAFSSPFPFKTFEEINFSKPTYVYARLLHCKSLTQTAHVRIPPWIIHSQVRLFIRDDDDA